MGGKYCSAYGCTVDDSFCARRHVMGVRGRNGVYSLCVECNEGARAQKNIKAEVRISKAEIGRLRSLESLKTRNRLKRLKKVDYLVDLGVVEGGEN